MKLLLILLVLLGCVTTPGDKRVVLLEVINESRHDASVYLARSESNRTRLGEVTGNRGTFARLVPRSQFSSATRLAIREVAGGEWMSDPILLPFDALRIELTIVHDGLAPHGFVSYF